MSKAMFTVFGATGQQGGSVIEEFLREPKLSTVYSLRAVTRDASKPKSLALKEKGVEVVEADLDDPTSVKNAVKGSRAVFGVTDFWATNSFEREVAQGKAIADAAKENGVEHLIWSSLPDVTKMTNGQLNMVKHFDSKAKVQEYIVTLGIPATFIFTGFFMTNMKVLPREGEDGTFTWAAPLEPEKTQIPLFDAAGDMGVYVGTALILGATNPPATIWAASEFLTPNQLMHTIQTVSGKKSAFVPVDDATFASFLPEYMREEMGENLKLVRDPGYYGSEGQQRVAEGLSLVSNAGMRNPIRFEEFVERSF